MRTFLEGCLMGFLMIVLIIIILGSILGSALLLMYCLNNYPYYSFLGLCVICIVGCGIDEWWKEYQYHKKYYGRNENE